MMKSALKLLVFILISSIASCTSLQKTLPENSTGNLIIYYDSTAGNGKLLEAAKEYGSKVLYVYKNINGITVTVPKNQTVPQAIKYYEKVEGVLSVSRDRMMQLN